MEGKKNVSHFISEMIDRDLRDGTYTHVQTRFPPEPNGYLHIGHAKAISVDFGMAEQYNGVCHLRFDDTNPEKEDEEYVDAIMEDIRWLGFRWDKVLYASDYFDFIYACAVKLIEKGLAFVCELSAEQIRETRGTLTAPGTESPYRDRPIEENLDLFKRMTAGEFENGVMVLRAKIDMTSPNLNMRDPVIYRIVHASHHHVGDKWCVYPMYDMAHPLSDAAEGTTHSLCTLEFENHRPLYDWFLVNCDIQSPPRQTEFARMNVNYTLTSKRKCLQLVKENHVAGWDDPRMATLCGMRRRGYPPAALRDFCERIGVSKASSVIDYALLEACVREELNVSASRAMCVLDPVRLVLDNYPEGQIEDIPVEINPEKPELGSRNVSFGRELYIEAGDFMENPPGKYHRLSPGAEVRLKGAYLVICTGCDKDADGKVVCVHATVAMDTRGGEAPDHHRVKGTIHWVAAHDALDVTVNLYDRLFLQENPSDIPEGKTLANILNPDSLRALSGCKLESGLHDVRPGDTFQFMRQGYFCVDPDSSDGALVFNRTVALKDTWGKQNKG